MTDITIQFGRPIYPFAKTNKLTGNRCDHDPKNPEFRRQEQIKKGKGGLPWVLTKCIERIEQFYDRPRALIPSLDLANGSKRKMRAERRDACVSILKSLMKHLDLASLRVGLPTKDGFINYTYELIVKDTNLSYKRVERAVADLKSAGILSVTQPRYTNEDGQIRGLAAIKCISKNFFALLGLKRQLKYARDYCSKKMKQKFKAEKEADAKSTLTSNARYALFVEAEKAKMAKASKQYETSPEKINYQKRQQLLAIEIRKKIPNLSALEYMELAAEELKKA